MAVILNPNTGIFYQSDIILIKMKPKYLSITIFLVVCLSYSVLTKAQCKEMIGYDSKGILGSTKILKGHLSQSDTATSMFFTAKILKTEMTNGIWLFGIFSKVGTVDVSTKVKIIFPDDTFIILTDYSSHEDGNSNSANVSNDKGIFQAIISDKYRLLLLKTKPISKVQITGIQLDPKTYLVNGNISYDFLLGMGCLQEYL